LLSPEATEQTIYRRDSATDLFTPLLTAQNVATGVKFQEEGGAVATFEDATPDLSHIILYSSLTLTKNASGPSLYEWTDGQLQLVSILPDRSPAPTARFGSQAGYQ